MQKWEYLLVELGNRTKYLPAEDVLVLHRGIESSLPRKNFLDALGESGWELVHVVYETHTPDEFGNPLNIHHTLYFKRTKE